MTAATDPLSVVWLTTDYPWEESPVLGIFHRTAARALVAAGVDVTVVAPTPAAPWPLPLLRPGWRLYARAPREAVDHGVRVARPPYLALPGQPEWARPELLLARAAARVRRAAWPRARLIHAHYAAPVGMAALHLARRVGLPYLVTLHGDDVSSWPALHPRSLPAYRAALRRAARVIAVSQALADEAGRIADVEPQVIPIGVDLARFTEAAPNRATARGSLGIGDDEVMVLMVAVLEPRKRVRELVDAVHAVGSPFRLLLVGTGPEAGYRARPGVVEYLGAYPNTEVPRFLAAADVAVLASEREGLPTALVEAGAAGVPIIASRAGGIPELLAHDRGTLIDDVSAEGIAAALRGFVADRPGAARRAARLRAHVLDEYDAAASARRLRQLYGEVIGTDERRPVRLHSGPGHELG